MPAALFEGTQEQGNNKVDRLIGMSLIEKVRMVYRILKQSEVENVEKKVVILITIMTIIINIFSFLHINENTIDKLLYDKTTISFNIYTKDTDEPISELLKKIKKFSEMNNVEIAQYSFLSSDKVDIYSTKKDEYNEVVFIPNVFFNKEIRIHNFQKIVDVGFKNLLYIDTKDKRIIQSLSDELKEECEISYSVADIMDNKILGYMDINSLPIFAIFVFLFILIVFFYYSRNRNEFVICKLWGRTYVQTYCILNKFLYKPLFLPIILNGLVTIGIIFRFGFSNLFLEVFFEMMELNIIIIFLLFLLSIVIFFLSFVTIDNHNRKKAMSKVIIISYVSRFFLLFLIIFFINNFFDQKEELDKNLDNLTAWNDTKNLFNLQEIYSPFNYSNLATEDVLNNKILRVYQDLSNLNKVFIINTLNFERPNITKDNKEDYNYLSDVKNEEDLYSPYGRNIVVDKNYIEKRKIKSASRKNVVDIIDNNEDVLNVLVPQKYKKYEEAIENSFKEWFYFQKVEVTNMYKEASNQKKIQKNFDDLNVNIIYIENNQRYFTYNQYSGDSMNTIKDPIITVYTGNIDNSYLGSCLGSYMFVESKDEYSALKEINSITKRYNVNELNSIASVYDKKGKEIQDLKDRINQLIINTIIIFLFLIMFMIVITFFYYKLFFREIIIKSLYGYPFTYIYKSLILANLFINISIVPFLVIAYKRMPLYMIIIIGLISFLDYFVVRILDMYLFVKGEIQFIKGDFK